MFTEKNPDPEGKPTETYGNASTITKYLLYAIGEILLVMVGILLALQVNNWNDHKKQVKKEKEILQQFKNELNEDQLILYEIMEDNQFIIRSCNVLISHLENDLPYNDSLSIYFDRWASPNVCTKSPT